MPLELVVQYADRTRRFALSPGDAIIGSSAASTIRIAHPTVSRRHARLRVALDSVELTDLGSRNGTRVGTRKIDDTTAIHPGTVVAFGGVSALFERVDEDDLEPAFLLEHPTGIGSDLTPAPVASEPLDTATASVEPFDLFLREGLPNLVAGVERGIDPMVVAQQVGAVLARGLPCLGLVIEHAEYPRPERLFALSGGVDPEDGVEGSLRVELGDLSLGYVLPTATLAEMFQPLADLGLGLIELARRRSAPPPEKRFRHVPPAPPLPVPASVVPVVQSIYADAARVARGELSILIRGASGTGKEVLARYIHGASRRALGPFLALNCAALPQNLLEAELFGIERGVATGVEARPGTFERASGGTLFLDEVGDMALETQAKLLRALEVGHLYRLGSERPYPVDVRVISATNLDLARMMNEERFRQDLYFRIADWEVELPTLTERRVDVPHLAGHFLGEESRRLNRRIRGISRAAMVALQSYAWPGNVRQLKKEMSRVALLLGSGELLDSSRLEPSIAAAGSKSSTTLKETLQQAERRFLEETLLACGGDRKEAARRLKVSDITLYRRMKSYDLS